MRRQGGYALMLAVLLMTQQKTVGQGSVLEPALPTAGVPDTAVWAVLVLDSGMILAGGEFENIGGEPRQHLVRLHDDGAVDTAFAGGADGAVNRLVRLPDGKILIGGSFSEVQGLRRRGIARLFSDGTVDPGFDAGINYSNSEGVLSIAIQGDGKIVTSSYSAINVSRLQRLNEDGTLDASFANTNVFDYYVTALLVQTNGMIWVGGGFQHVNSEPRNAIAVVDASGSLAAASVPDLRQYSDVFTFLEQTNGSVLVGGVLIRAAANATNTTLLARLTAQLEWDANYAPDVFDVAGSAIGAMLLQPDGKLVVAGNFKEVGGFSRRGVARLDPDGRIDPCFDPGLGFESSIGARSLARQDDGRIWAGGFFFGDMGIAHIARLLPQGDCNVTRVYLRERTPGMVSIAATCTPGGTNLLEASENLMDWSIVGTSVTPHLPFVDFSTALSPARFFRVRKQY